MAVNVAINGFGRIGRLVLRAIAESGRKDIKVVAINDLGPVETNAHLLRYDSVHGRFLGEVKVEGDTIDIGTGPIKVTAVRDPAELPHKALGVEIALDDFGTGYSSLSYLRSFPFDTLKIDRGFVSDLGADTGSNIIVQAVILIAGGLGIRTVAEGIETSVQHEILKTLGCDAVQGYLFGRPVPVTKVPALIDEWTGKKILAA